MQKIDIFKNLSKDQLAVVLGCCREKQYELGARLFGEGEHASHIYIVRKGRIDLRFDLPGRDCSEKNTISTISEFGALGWSCFVPPYKYSLSAFCTTRTLEVIRIEKDSLAQVFETDNRLAYIVLSNLAILIGKRFQQLEKSASDAPVSMVKISVHLATCGIAAGAREVMGALMEELSRSGRHDLSVASSGCLGKCSTEPNVTIEIEGEDPVIYQKMNSEKMHQVFRQHILGGRIQTDFIIEE